MDYQLGGTGGYAGSSSGDLKGRRLMRHWENICQWKWISEIQIVGVLVVVEVFSWFRYSLHMKKAKKGKKVSK